MIHDIFGIKRRIKTLSLKMYYHMQTTLQVLMSGIGGGKKRKERFETILEPLQAIIQIGFLTYCPIGTKVAIHNNLLIIQMPGYSQQMARWYNNDSKEDLFFLYNVFSRFSRFYDFLLTGNENNKALYALLMQLAKTGITNLIRTYTQCGDGTHILHTLHLYRGMLENPELVKHLNGGSAAATTSTTTTTTVATMSAAATSEAGTTDEKKGGDKKKGTMKSAVPSQPVAGEDSQGGGGGGTTPSALQLTFDPHAMSASVDDVFVKIIDLYTQEDYNIIYNALVRMGRDTTNYECYVSGLNRMYEPINVRIKKWIDENIIF